jgi:hypothetical protein
MKKINTVLLISLVAASFSTNALANDEKIDYSFSAKMWNTQIRNNGEAASQSTNAPILSVTARKGNYFGTASFLNPTTYTNGATYTTRRDSDIAFGYAISSNISFLVGQKLVSADKYDSGSWNYERVHASYLGANGFSAISDNQFLYGTFFRSFKARDSNGGISKSVVLTNYEGGYGYVLEKGIQLTAGYRLQKFDISGGGAKIPGLIFGMSFSHN